MWSSFFFCNLCGKGGGGLGTFTGAETVSSLFASCVALGINSPSDSAQDVWEDLKERFNKVDGSRSFSIHQEIVKLTQGTTSVATYFTKMKELWVELEALVPLPGCKCDKSREFVAYLQRQKLYQFLMGLNDNYLQARSQILLMTPLPSVNQAYAMIVSDKSQKAMGTISNSVGLLGTMSTLDPTAMYSKTGYQEYKYKRKGGPCGSSAAYNVFSEEASNELTQLDNQRNNKANIDLCSGNVNKIDKESEGLYLLLNKSIGKLGKPSLKVHQVTAITEDKIKLWHMRFGSVSSTTLNKILHAKN
ncbi:uncharacterized protein [Nicotiana sylvestris]|uniref:uncharacterized protein n=1 Tax=Nicotiana sylvestris TaxID=4096 RepID=UPI00388CC622